MAYDGPTAADLLQRFLQTNTQAELAKKLEVEPKTIAAWKRGDTPLTGWRELALEGLNHREGLVRTSPQAGDFTFADLFAGIGGTRLGFESAGGQCVWTSEWDKFARETYIKNHNTDHHFAGDITQIHTDDIPDHDVLVGGFPCQPFSIAGVSKKNALGTPHGFACEAQGTLFFDISRIIKAKQPKAFVLENVKNLERHNKGDTFKVIKGVLESELGYHVTHRIIDAKRFVPQHRERIFIVGFKDDVGFDWQNLDLPEVSDGPRLKSILHPQDGSEVADGRFTVGKDAKVNRKYRLTENLWKYLVAYAKKHKAKGNGFGYGQVGPDDVTRTLSARYYKDGSEILFRRGRKRPRRLTPRECARLMGFPDWFEIPVSDTQAYKQFGNSVVVPVVEAVAKCIKPFLEKAIEIKAAA